MIEPRVPAADATVWTMLFWRMPERPSAFSTAIEMTAAGIDVAKVRPTRRPRKTLAAVKISVSREPSTSAPIVSSFSVPVRFISAPCYPGGLVGEQGRLGNALFS